MLLYIYKLGLNVTTSTEKTLFSLAMIHSNKQTTVFFQSKQNVCGCIMQTPVLLK